MEVINMHQAKTNLSKLVEKVISGETVYISKRGKVVAQLSGIGNAEVKRQGGVLKGEIQMSDDFDDLPDDIMSAFNGRG